MNETEPIPEAIDPHHLRLLEALVFASTDPVPETVMADRLPEDAPIAALVAQLCQDYAERGVNLVKIGRGWAFHTAEDLGTQLVVERTVTRKLSRAAVETLAVIAYHQPVTRTEIEGIRGVGLSKGTMDVLFEAGWIRPRGRRRTPGKPVTWGTTDSFLGQFGLEALDDLPGVDDLKAAGLLDKRPAVQTLGTHAAAFPVSSDDDEDGNADADQDGEEDDALDMEADAELSELDPLDPDDSDPTASTG
jgi:segregation and condensation protein B